MTEPDAAGTQIPDFTIHREPHRFKIDNDTFSAPALLSPVTLRKLAAQAASVGDVGKLTDAESVVKAMEALAEIMRALMPGSSGAVFAARLWSEGGEDDPPPIDLMKQAIPAMYYLMECYGLLPTKPSSDSPAGSTDGQTSTPSAGISSTAGASPTESTSPDSPSPTGSI